MNGIKTCLRILNITDLQEADEDGGGGLDMDEFRQAMIKTMAGKGEVVRHKLYNSILTSCMTLYVLQSLGELWDLVELLGLLLLLLLLLKF